MGPQISVIVCVHNGQRFLSACIDSILKQKYRDFELVVVNDGSTDESYKIINEYQQQDDRIRIFNQSQQGIGVARNTGLNITRGKYVTFIDSDDWVTPEYLIHLFNQIQVNQVEIAVSNYCEYYQNKAEVGYYGNLQDKEKYERLYTPAEWVSARTNNLFGLNYAVAWGKLFNKKVFNQVTFPTDVKVGEDEATLWKTYLQANLISFSFAADYIYRKHDSSVTSNQRSINADQSSKALIDQIGMMKMKNIDTSSLENYYIQRLEFVGNMAIKNGNFFAFQDADLRFRLLKKYNKL